MPGLCLELSEQEIANLREGARLGFTAPQTAVKVVIRQLGDQDGECVGTNALLDSIKKCLMLMQTRSKL